MGGLVEGDAEGTLPAPRGRLRRRLPRRVEDNYELLLRARARKARSGRCRRGGQRHDKRGGRRVRRPRDGRSDGSVSVTVASGRGLEVTTVLQP